MSVTESETEDSELVHDPASASPLKRWVLLDGSRVALAAGLASGLLLALLALFGVGLFRPTDGESVGALLTALIGGTLPFITIVLAVIQLVLSQELGWPEGLRERFEGAEEFREDVEATAGRTVSPASPAAFLRRIVTANADRATTLPSLLVEETDEEFAATVERYAAAVEAESETVAETLADADLGTFDALSAVLDRHHGEHYHIARRFQVDHPDAFAETEPLEEMIELMKYLAVARQTFKTMYIQHELATLSRRLLYVGLPTLVGGGVLVLVYPTVIDLVSSRDLLVAIAAAGITLVFLPFVVLLSHTLRIATIAARTGDFGPFVPRSTE
ncbi:hypothetical protein BRC94_08625 [Halobacteriales archaeon QS_5_70_17]|nr:MAG: hypothetical protein BRC94_08625 [Halobacteriales archaeon QS_5_70_17]